MKQGRTLEQLGAELRRQRTARADFIADTRQLNFKTDNNKSRITFESGNKTMDFGINQLAHLIRGGVPAIISEEDFDKVQQILEKCK